MTVVECNSKYYGDMNTSISFPILIEELNERPLAGDLEIGFGLSASN